MVDEASEYSLLGIIPLSGAVGPLLTPYSVRGITQTLAPISSAAGGGSALGTWMRRDINGTLVRCAPPQFRKYAATVTCTDQSSPAFDDVWLGTVVTFQSAVELSYATIGGAPFRTPVDGSERVENDFTFYRPQMTMMITEIENSMAEWRAEFVWKISLQEV